MPTDRSTVVFTILCSTLVELGFRHLERRPFLMALFSIRNSLALVTK